MNKSMLVTGGTLGTTGFAIAQRFAKEGYDVFITSRTGEKSQAAAEEIMRQYSVKAYGFELKVTDEQEIIHLFDKIRKLGYLLNTLVLNSANLGIGQDFLTCDIEEFKDVFKTNIFWNFAISRQAALQMKENGGGSIVFVTSNTAYRAIPDRCAYGASKSGILGMARSMALDLGKYGIRTNCVLPGMIKTSRWKNNPSLHTVLSAYTPLGDIAEFEDIANAVYYFGSDQSRNTTGAELTVDGGNMCQLYPIIPENKE